MARLNEKGILWLTILLISIPAAMLAVALIPDIERANWSRNKLQSTVDAAALAGALTATVIPEYKTVYETDASGNITGIRNEITGYKAEIQDPAAADAAALDAVLRNTTYLSAKNGGFSAMEQFNPFTDYSGSVAGSDIYSTSAAVRVRTLLLGPAMRAYGLSEGDVLVERVGSSARAVGVGGP